jgi:hypothetical protein
MQGNGPSRKRRREAAKDGRAGAARSLHYCAQMEGSAGVRQLPTTPCPFFRGAHVLTIAPDSQW